MHPLFPPGLYHCYTILLLRNFVYWQRSCHHRSVICTYRFLSFSPPFFIILLLLTHTSPCDFLILPWKRRVLSPPFPSPALPCTFPLSLTHWTSHDRDSSSVTCTYVRGAVSQETCTFHHPYLILLLPPSLSVNSSFILSWHLFEKIGEREKKAPRTSPCPYFSSSSWKYLLHIVLLLPTCFTLFLSSFLSWWFYHLLPFLSFSPPSSPCTTDTQIRTTTTTTNMVVGPSLKLQSGLTNNARRHQTLT